MPTYIYKCDRCAGEIEVNRAMKDEESAPWCGDCCQPMTRVWSSPGVVFNGNGFYSTDNRK